MAARLPIELFDLVAQYSTMSTQASLSAVSRSLYFISIPPLYASIPHMSTLRTIQCLLTLSTSPKLARLVRSFSLQLHSPVPNIFPYYLTCALGNMTELTSLSLQPGRFATSIVLSKVSCRLKKLVCVLMSDHTYPISKFLSGQPTIEELYLVCRSDGLVDFHPEALPALRDLAAPLHLIPKLLSFHPPRLSRLSVLGSMAGFDQCVELNVAVKSVEPPRLSELVIGIDLTAFLTRRELAAGLAVLGSSTPLLRLFRLEIHQGHLKEDGLEYVFRSALPYFPNLTTLVVMSQLPTPSAYIRNPPRVQPGQTSRSIPLASSPLTAEFPTPPPRALLTSPNSREKQIESKFVLDALHDTACHLKILKSWHQVHPRLERVVFPVGTYTYANRKQSRSG